MFPSEPAQPHWLAFVDLDAILDVALLLHLVLLARVLLGLALLGDVPILLLVEAQPLDRLVDVVLDLDLVGHFLGMLVAHAILLTQRLDRLELLVVVGYHGLVRDEALRDQLPFVLQQALLVQVAHLSPLARLLVPVRHVPQVDRLKALGLVVPLFLPDGQLHELVLVEDLLLARHPIETRILRRLLFARVRRAVKHLRQCLLV
mmetsp:Transcript_13125/g.26634  ORF Transcript_13125/g.26634 Transcript_13125/m.26634 type:complete len:204 (-) Transcript_13125:314-925(-)